LRQQVEGQLWGNGDFSLDDIYAKLLQVTGRSEAELALLKTLELAEEWDNLIPISEMTSRVQPNDIVVTDMYLPLSFIRNVVDKKCGLPGATIYLSNHGKHFGTIWPQLQARHRILQHHGDNKHSDVVQAARVGIEAAHVTLHDWTFGESTLNSVGLEAFSRVVRKSRLTSFTFDKTLRQARLAQFDVNIPVLVIASILLMRHSQSMQADTMLMCGRDCNLWVVLLRCMLHLSSYRSEAIYFPSSRDLFLADSPDYAAYFCRLRGTRTIITDLSGTGRTPAHFIGSVGAQADTSVYIALKSDNVDPAMDQRAPARSNVKVNFAIKDDDARFLFEKLNTAVEGRATAMEFTGHDSRSFMIAIIGTHVPKK